MVTALRRGGLSHGGRADKEGRRRQKRIVPAEPVKPLMKATLASRGATYSL